MFLTIATIGIFLFLVLLAVLFRRTLRAMESPRYVIEKPPMPKEVSAALARIERWRDEGRLTREEYEKLNQLCEEDSGLPSGTTDNPSEN